MDGAGRPKTVEQLGQHKNIVQGEEGEYALPKANETLKMSGKGGTPEKIDGEPAEAGEAEQRESHAVVDAPGLEHCAVFEQQPGKDKHGTRPDGDP